MADTVFTFREIREWPGKATPAYQRVRAPFKGNWGRTLDLLARELRMLNAAEVTLEGYFTMRHIRRDGQLYADARPSAPGVVLEFRSRTKGTRFRFAADKFGFWQDNVDAIARSLEALRMVDRYGVTSGQQYEGFKALPATGSTTANAVSAATLIAMAAGVQPHEVLADKAKASAAIGVARNRTHPDRGGTHEEFVAIETAAKAVLAHHGT